MSQVGLLTRPLPTTAGHVAQVTSYHNTGLVRFFLIENRHNNFDHRAWAQTSIRFCQLYYILKYLRVQN
jgi:hypothetical protein